MSKVSNFMVLTTSEAAPIDRADGVIIGRLSELTDEDCKEFVDLVGNCYNSKNEHSYCLFRNYLNSDLYFKSTKESLKSRLKYEGIDVNENDFIVKLND